MNRTFRKLARLVLLVIFLVTLTAGTSSNSVTLAAPDPAASSAEPVQVAAAKITLPVRCLSSSVMQADSPGIDPALLQRLRQNGAAG